MLAAYGSTVNVPRWDFGRLLGVYVALFFLMAQILNKVRFGQAPTVPIYAGGGLIVAGGLLMAFWKGLNRQVGLRAIPGQRKNKDAPSLGPGIL